MDGLTIVDAILVGIKGMAWFGIMGTIGLIIADATGMLIEIPSSIMMMDSTSHFKINPLL